MPKSMTGFGSGRASAGTEEISVELKAVNHKFCEVKVRTPRELATLEPLAVKQVKDRVARGAVELTLRRASSTVGGEVPKVDLELARHYRAALSQIAQATGVPDQPELRDIALQAGVLRLEETAADLDAAGQALTKALGQALDGLTSMRTHEGAVLNVFTPSVNDGRRRPVMVWLHGGGFASGSGAYTISAPSQGKWDLSTKRPTAIAVQNIIWPDGDVSQ